VALTDTVATSKLTFMTPFKDSVDRVISEGIFKRHPDASLHTSGVGAASPIHVPGLENSPDLAGMKATLL